MLEQIRQDGSQAEIMNLGKDKVLKVTDPDGNVSYQSPFLYNLDSPIDANLDLGDVGDLDAGEAERAEKTPEDPSAGKDYQIKYYDPLVLDLNGDGVINTFAASQLNGALFDHDGDGIRTSSGWLTGGDALLVRDINKDGVINTGTEIFGDHTLLKN